MYCWLALMALPILLLLGGCSQEVPPVEAKTVLVAAARAAEDPAGVVIGTVRSSQLHAVAAQNGGRVVRLLADIGSRVRADEVLAVLDNSAESLKLAQASADAARLAAVAEERQHNFKRMEALMRAAAISSSAFDAAKSDALSSQRAVEAARKLQALVQRDLNLTIIRAPIAGVIASRPVRLSDQVAAGAVLFEVDGLGPREVVASAPERESVRLGTTLVVRTATGEGTGIVTDVGERVSANGSRDIRLQLVSGKFAPGAVVEVVLATRTALGSEVLVPSTAIVEPAGSAKAVFVVTKDDHLKRVPVLLRAFGAAGALVAGPIEAGDFVVVAGGSFLIPGMAVKPVQTAR
jgi:multidrug efflux system membrane fusion protein